MIDHFRWLSFRRFLGCGRSLVTPGGVAFASLSVQYLHITYISSTCLCVFAYNEYILIPFRVLITTSGRQSGHYSPDVCVGGCCVVTDKCSGSIILFVHRVYVHRYTYVVKETREVNRPETPVYSSLPSLSASRQIYCSYTRIASSASRPSRVNTNRGICVLVEFTTEN